MPKPGCSSQRALHSPNEGRGGFRVNLIDLSGQRVPDPSLVLRPHSRAADRRNHYVFGADMSAERPADPRRERTTTRDEHPEHTNSQIPLVRTSSKSVVKRTPELPRRASQGRPLIGFLARDRPKTIPSLVASKLPTQGPMYPTLRANPFPEVTDLFCRLPLSTLFYQLEAVHLGDLLRL